MIRIYIIACSNCYLLIKKIIQFSNSKKVLSKLWIKLLLVMRSIRFAANHYCLYIIVTHIELLLNYTLLFFFLNTLSLKISTAVTLNKPQPPKKQRFTRIFRFQKLQRLPPNIDIKPQLTIILLSRIKLIPTPPPPSYFSIK